MKYFYTLMAISMIIALSACLEDGQTLSLSGAEQEVPEHDHDTKHEHDPVETEAATSTPITL